MKSVLCDLDCPQTVEQYKAKSVDSGICMCMRYAWFTFVFSSKDCKMNEETNP